MIGLILLGVLIFFGFMVVVTNTMIGINAALDEAFYSMSAPDHDHPAWLNDDESWPA